MQMLLNQVEVATPGLRVCDVMRPCEIRVRADATAREGAALLAYYDRTSVPVVGRDGLRVVGLLSASDILHLRARENEPDAAGAPPPSGQDGAGSLLDTYRVGEIMLPVLFSLEPSATLRELADLVERTGTDHVLVLEDGRLRGVVTATDLLRAFSIAPRR